MRALLRVLLTGLLLATAGGAAQAAAAPSPQAEAAQARAALEGNGGLEQESLHRGFIALPLAATLGTALALRPRRRHAPPRNPEVVQTQIMLTLVGSLVMLVVGASLARAFGIAGAASLVRYRAKVSDPKDASVMLSALGIGLATGVGLFWLASAATVFILAVLWALEWLEPRRTVPFDLRVRLAQAPELRPRLEAVLRRHRLRHHLRTSSNDEISYEVDVPFGRPLEALSEAIMGLGGEQPAAIEWEEKKPK